MHSDFRPTPYNKILLKELRKITKTVSVDWQISGWELNRGPSKKKSEVVPIRWQHKVILKSMVSSLLSVKYFELQKQRKKPLCDLLSARNLKILFCPVCAVILPHYPSNHWFIFQGKKLFPEVQYHHSVSRTNFGELTSTGLRCSASFRSRIACGNDRLCGPHINQTSGEERLNNNNEVLKFVPM